MPTELIEDGGMYEGSREELREADTQQLKGSHWELQELIKVSAFLHVLYPPWAVDLILSQTDELVHAVLDSAYAQLYCLLNWELWDPWHLFRADGIDRLNASTVSSL